MLALPALVLGSVLLLAPAVRALPPYVTLEYLAVGGACVLAVLALALGARVTAMIALVRALRSTPERER